MRLLGTLRVTVNVMLPASSSALAASDSNLSTGVLVSLTRTSTAAARWPS